MHFAKNVEKQLQAFSCHMLKNCFSLHDPPILSMVVCLVLKSMIFTFQFSLCNFAYAILSMQLSQHKFANVKDRYITGY